MTQYCCCGVVLATVGLWPAGLGVVVVPVSARATGTSARNASTPKMQSRNALPTAGVPRHVTRRSRSCSVTFSNIALSFWWTSVRGTVLLSDLTIKMVLAGMVRLVRYMDYLLVELAPDGYHHPCRGFSSRIRRARHRERGLGPRCSRVRREGGGAGRDRDEGLAPVVQL